MLHGYTTNVPALRPLMAELDAVLLTAREVAGHLRFSTEQLSNLRRSGKGPGFIRLPTGGIRYRMSAVSEWQLSGEAGALTLERVALAVAACASVPIEYRAAILAHLEAALPAMDGMALGRDDEGEPTPSAPSQSAVTLALLEQAEAEAMARIEEAKADTVAQIGAAKAKLRQAEAQQAPAKRGRGKPKRQG